MKKLNADKMDYKVLVPHLTLNAEIINWMAENLTGYYKMMMIFGSIPLDSFNTKDEEKEWYNGRRGQVTYMTKNNSAYCYALQHIDFELEEDAVAFKMRWIER